ncbi:MAG: hypothetical protein OXR73_19385 [Myxococcales bacterium]|nr:hypothetical protein [Myxococcales bacterium]
MGRVRDLAAGILLTLPLSGAGMAFAQDETRAEDRAEDRAKAKEAAQDTRASTTDTTGSESPAQAGSKAQATKAGHQQNAQRSAAADGERKGRGQRRVRVRSSVTVIDPRADVGDIISEIRRGDRTQRARGAVRKAQRRRDDARRRPDRSGPSATRAPGAGRPRQVQPVQVQDRHKRRDARLNRRGDTFRRRTGRSARPPAPVQPEGERERERHHRRFRRF